MERKDTTVEAMQEKVDKLRKIVAYQAPHDRNCQHIEGKPCNCWKAEFMAEVGA